MFIVIERSPERTSVNRMRDVMTETGKMGANVSFKKTIVKKRPRGTIRLMTNAPRPTEKLRNSGHLPFFGPAFDDARRSCESQFSMFGAGLWRLKQTSLVLGGRAEKRILSDTVH
jgi:hypothetical protein